MNYSRIYDELIFKYGSWTKPKEIYTERHRKVPGYLGGKYVHGNAFYVSARVHYLCHLLLAKIYGGVMWKPIILMGYRSDKTSSKMYEKAKKEQAIWMSKYAPCKNPEIAKRHSEWMKGDNNPTKRSEVRKLVSERFKGIKKTEEHKSKIADTYKDPKKREIQLSQIHNMLKCSECGMITNVGNLAKHQRSTGHIGKERV